MRILVSIVISVIVFFAVGFSLDEFTRMNGNNIFAVALAAGIITLVFSIYKMRSGKGGVELASEALSAIKDAKESIEMNIDNKHADLFAVAENEYEKGDIDKGLWSQALVKAKGNEQLRKVEYMKLRVRQLKKKS